MQEPACSSQAPLLGISPEVNILDLSEVTEECTISRVFNLIRNLKRVRAFGLFLKIEPWKLDQIYRSSFPSPLQGIVREWFKHAITNTDGSMSDNGARWKELHQVLLEPAVNELRLAYTLPSYHERRSSVDPAISSCDRQLPDIESIGEGKECTILNVLNSIVPYFDWYSIGSNLDLPPYELDEIKHYDRADQQAHFVELWYKSTHEDGFCWEKLKLALRSLSESPKLYRGSTAPTSAEPSVLTWPSLREELQELQFTFESIQQVTMEELDRRGVKFKQFKRAVCSFALNVQLNSFTSFKKVSGSVEIEDVFNIWNKDMMWSFLDFNLLERIVKQYGTCEIKTTMKKYSNWVEDFRQRTTVSRVMDLWSELWGKPNQPEEYEKCKQMIVDLNIKAAECTLEKLERLRKRSCQLLKGIPLSEAALVLFELKPGSLHLTWLVWTDVVQDFKKALIQCVNDGEYFKENNIIILELDGEHFMPMERSLMLASVKGDAEAVKRLLDRWNKNHDINETDPLQDDRTALLLAVQNGHRVLVKPLLDHGADIYHRDRNGDSVLTLSKPHGELHNKFQIKCELEMIRAAERGDLPFLKRALDIGVDLNAQESDDYGWTALLYACDKSWQDVVDYLLDNGADINATDSQDWTGLILSSRRGKLHIVKKLLDSGADIHKQTDMLWSALMWAADQGHTDVAKLLLDRGSVATVGDKLGFTPLLIASQNGHMGVVKVLVEHDTGIVDQLTNTGWSAVMVATKNGHQDIIQYLVDKGSDEKYRKEDGVTALHIASFKGHNTIVRYLCLKKKLDVDTQDKDGITPLMYAAKQGHLNVVKTLVGNKHADVNLTEEDNGWTALFFAMEAQKHKVLEYLLETRRVDVMHKDDRGNTLVDIAKIVNPTALEYLSLYNRAEMETMSLRPAAQPVNMEDYKPMLDKLKMITQTAIESTA